MMQIVGQPVTKKPKSIIICLVLLNNDNFDLIWKAGDVSPICCRLRSVGVASANQSAWLVASSVDARASSDLSCARASACQQVAQCHQQWLTSAACPCFHLARVVHLCPPLKIRTFCFSSSISACLILCGRLLSYTIPVLIINVVDTKQKQLTCSQTTTRR